MAQHSFFEKEVDNDDNTVPLISIRSYLFWNFMQAGIQMCTLIVFPRVSNGAILWSDAKEDKLVPRKKNFFDIKEKGK